MTRPLALLALLAPLALAQHAPQRLSSDMLEPELEARVQALGKQLRCATCQGVAIADSPASMARAQLEAVRSLVAEGKSDEEIRQYFVARYGEWVLLSPRATGFNWVVWLGPGVLLLLGGGVIYRLVHPGKDGGADAGAPPPPPPPATDEEDPYLAAVRKELER